MGLSVWRGRPYSKTRSGGEGRTLFGVQELALKAL